MERKERSVAKQRILKVINYWSQKWFIIICFLARLPSSSLSSFFLSHTPIIRERKKAKNKKEDKEEYICVWTRRNLDLDFAFLHFPLLIICLRKWKKKGRDPGYVLSWLSLMFLLFFLFIIPFPYQDFLILSYSLSSPLQCSLGWI